MTTSAEITTTSRRVPSAVEERGEPSYAVFEDSLDNQGSSIDTLSTDFNSPEEIQVLNERLDNLQSMIDYFSDISLTDGGAGADADD